MRIVYSLLWWLALPLVLARLWLRGRKEPGYRQHWGERLGLYGRAAWSTPATPVLWVHAVSVGETRAAEPLVDALLAAYPHSRVVLTHMTPTGRETGRTLFAKHGARLVQSFLPYDTGLMVSRFIAHFQPSVCILMETEVWPNLIATCGRRGVPVMLANARLSQRSLGKAQRLGALIREAAHGVTLVAAQTEADAARVRTLGAPRVEVTGSIKFDVVVPPAALATGAALRQAIDAGGSTIGTRPVLLCASTREGEETLILDAYRQARASLPAGTLLLLVPRHPQRFAEVEQLVAAAGLTVQRRSTLALGDAQPAAPAASVDAATDVLLGDSMGEMFAYYAACDVAFVGGSLLPLGGQNLIEPAALGKPVMIGPHTFNFELVTEDAIAGGGALRVADAGALMTQAARLLGDDAARAAMGASAMAFANQHRGATARTLALLPSLLQR
ncbi:MAG: lipid IV(A) 3-deoxy-D-manno-octulosonic acid transferase [Duganella sp.]